MKATIITSAAVLAASALAQGNSYIPSGISSQCSDYLNTLNQDTTLATCTSSLLSATSAFASSGNGTSSDVTSVLNKLCSTTNNACSNTYTRSLLTEFYTACSDEVAGSNPDTDVQEIYEILYTFSGFRAAVCATDTTTGNYCASSLGSSGSNSKRASSDPTVDPTDFNNKGYAFQFLQASSFTAKMCTSCTAAILQAWTTWEAATPFAWGLTNSRMLKGQSALWSAVDSNCGASFLSTVTSNSNAAPLAALKDGGATPVNKPALSAFLGLAGLGAALLM